MGRASGLAGHVDVVQFREAVGKASQFDKVVKRELRAAFRAIATPIAGEIRSAVMATPGSGGDGQSTGLREDISQHVKVSIMAGNVAGISIRVTGTEHPSSVVRGYDKPGGWRHPVFDDDVWVDQLGHPYFATVIRPHRTDATRQVMAALNRANDTLKV